MKGVCTSSLQRLAEQFQVLLIQDEENREQRVLDDVAKPVELVPVQVRVELPFALGIGQLQVGGKERRKEAKRKEKIIKYKDRAFTKQGKLCDLAARATGANQRKRSHTPRAGIRLAEPAPRAVEDTAVAADRDAG